MNTNERDNLILQHISLANKLAWIHLKNTKRISIDELQAAAYMGLVLAANKYQEDTASFVTYATIKIIGSMKDYIRELRWGTRNNKKEAVPYNEDTYTKENNFSWVIFDLKPLEKKIISMYYEGGYTLKEIGKEIGLTESRVSQMLNQTRKTIKAEYAA